MSGVAGTRGSRKGISVNTWHHLEASPPFAQTSSLRKSEAPGAERCAIATSLVHSRKIQGKVARPTRGSAAAQCGPAAARGLQRGQQGPGLTGPGRAGPGRGGRRRGARGAHGRGGREGARRGCPRPARCSAWRPREAGRRARAGRRGARWWPWPRGSAAAVRQAGDDGGADVRLLACGPRGCEERWIGRWGPPSDAERPAVDGNGPCGRGGGRQLPWLGTGLGDRSASGARGARGPAWCAVVAGRQRGWGWTAGEAGRGVGPVADPAAGACPAAIQLSLPSSAHFGRDPASQS
jgi:hypothetical protein